MSSEDEAASPGVLDSSAGSRLVPGSRSDTRKDEFEQEMLAIQLLSCVGHAPSRDDGCAGTERRGVEPT